MNESAKPSWEDDDRIDRLVDGELTGQEYRELLRSLDQHPDGWRRCALAFLEAQAWQRELGALHQDEIVAPTAPPVALSGKRGRPRWASILAVAASFLVTFGLGVAYQAHWSESSSKPDGVPIATHDDPTKVDDAVPGTDTPPVPSPPDVQPPVGPRGYVTLARDGADGPGTEEFEVPLYDLSPENAWLLQDNRMWIPPEIRRAMQSMGRDIRWNRRLMPVETEDGQPAVVPIRRLEITPVNGQRYQ
jgi:hypothetical protein